MALRGTAARMLKAERRSRRIVGDRQIARLALAIERDLTPSMNEQRGGYTYRRPTIAPGATSKFYDERDILGSNQVGDTDYSRSSALNCSQPREANVMIYRMDAPLVATCPSWL